MLLVSIQNALLAFGERPLLDGAELAVRRGERAVYFRFASAGG